MTQPGEITEQEIYQQPGIVDFVLDKSQREHDEIQSFLNNHNPAEAIFCGSGTSYFLAQSCARIFQQYTGLRCRALPSSELFLFGDSLVSAGGESETLLFAFSRSGETTETVKAVRYADAKYGMDGFGFTCYPDSKLASSVNYAFTIEEGQEESVVMTKSFTGMLVALQRTATIYAGAHESYEELETLPSVIEETLHSSEKVIQALLTEGRPSQYVFLGAGPFYGLANESMLKMKEMALQITESFHPLEYRHGPKSTASEETLISVYCSDSGLDYELTLLQELKELGAQVVAISEQNGHLDRAVDFSLTLDSNLDQFLRISSYLPFAQLLALKVALAQGLNPDHPRNLDQVVRLEE